VPEPILGYRLQDGLASDVAESWRVDVNSHFVRKYSYKGAGSMVDATRFRIPFDGLTWPGTMFLTSYVLQARGCKPALQAATLDALETLLSNTMPDNLQLALIRGNPNCLLQVQRGFVNLNNWQNFLEFTGLLSKWQHCKLLSKAEQSVETGVRLHVATWFILRCAHAEKFDMAIDRFVARSGGFASAASETTLAEVGLEALAPSNYQRTTCDFIHRYLKKAETEVGEARKVEPSLESLTTN
ncbi:unnamed protein product, partial [Symbiodinium sp. CCMP2456]